MSEESLLAVEKWAEEYYGHSVLVGDVHRSLATSFDQYAESYHAKKCAECKKTTPKCVLCGDPITVGVCENCVPDMLSNEGHFHSTDIGNFRKKLNSDIDEIIKKEPEPPHA